MFGNFYWCGEKTSTAGVVSFCSSSPINPIRCRKKIATELKHCSDNAYDPNVKVKPPEGYNPWRDAWPGKETDKEEDTKEEEKKEEDKTDPTDEPEEPKEEEKEEEKKDEPTEPEVIVLPPTEEELEIDKLLPEKEKFEGPDEEELVEGTPIPQLLRH